MSLLIVILGPTGDSKHLGILTDKDHTDTYRINRGKSRRTVTLIRLVTRLCTTGFWTVQEVSWERPYSRVSAGEY